MSVFISHKRDDGTVQTVLDHLQGTARLSEQFASSFDAAEQGRLVGMTHDLGKYSDAFQNRILHQGPKVDHATAGALECAKRSQNLAAFCAAGHHSGLPDKGSSDDLTGRTLIGRLRQAMAGSIPDYSAWQKEITLPEAGYPDYLNKSAASDFFFTRMLYSCLVDADFLDTESFMQEGNVHRGNHAAIRELEAYLDAYIQNWFPPRGELNTRRCAILQACIQNHSLPPGIFTLTVPTGGGKTITSLAFSLKHARAHGLKRIIYVVPYTSIIEQTAEVFRRILGDENVLEHHSGVDYQSEDRVSEIDIRMNHATENWDMPVIVTTAVQFFESLFASKSSRCRKLHNIAQSIVIFDEAQMLPLPYLKPCIYAISELVKHYHVSAVLCTATQPSLSGIFRQYIEDFHPAELCPAELSEDPVFTRTKIHRAGAFSWQSIAGKMNEASQILCIVNSRKNARELYGLLKEEGRYHLSTLMTPVDRKKKLQEIRSRLSEGLPCRVVATSLIEAGVDVDFPQVIREEAGLDSILQAAGRCNREGKRPLEDSIVTVFQAETRPPSLFSTNIGAGRIALDALKETSMSGAIQVYFNTLLNLKGEDALDKLQVMKQISSGTFPFRTVSEQFHLIDTDTIPICIPVGQGAELLSRRLAGEVSRSLYRQLSMYSINIYPQHWSALYEAGDIEPMGENEWYLRNLQLYDPRTGLSLSSDSGKAEFI